MNLSDAASCASAAVCPFNPIQLLDSLDGHVRACYRCKQNGDQPAAISSLLFSGNSILAGGIRALFECDIVRCDFIGTPIVKCRGSIISLIGDEHHSAIGLSLSTGEVVFVDALSKEVIISLPIHKHAIDSMCWNDQKFMTSARLENQVFGFDLRNPVIPEFELKTSRLSSRFVSLSSSGDLFAVGNEEKEANVYRLSAIESEPLQVGTGRTSLAVLAENGRKLAVASGGFVFTAGQEEDDSDASFRPKLEAFSVMSEIDGIQRRE